MVVICLLMNGAERPDEVVDDLVVLQYAMRSNGVDFKKRRNERCT